jgi:hypothetical protein
LFYAWTGLNNNLPICASPHSWKGRHMPRCKPLVKTVSHQLFTRLALIQFFDSPTSK